MTYPWVGVGTKLSDYDIPRIGQEIGVGEDEIHAVLDVETGGTGFDQHGVIRLFEEHIFYRQLPAAKRSAAVAAGLAHPSWRRNYKDNYARFLRAYEFDPAAALGACSWGLGQIMGFNCKLAGYSSPLDMVRAFAVSEGNQLDGMIDFITAAGLADELRRHDWAGFAKGYNGAGYAANRYDKRLAERLAWWQKRPDTPWSPEFAKAESVSAAAVIEAEEKAVASPAAAPAPPGGSLVSAIFLLIRRILGGK